VVNQDTSSTDLTKDRHSPKEFSETRKTMWQDRKEEKLGKRSKYRYEQFVVEKDWTKEKGEEGGREEGSQGGP
jgi:hypothetical protein